MPKTTRRFDLNNNRVDYGELLSADSDYELVQAVGLTYSLDIEALMGIPLCLGMHSDMSSGLKNNPQYVLEAIRKTGKKISVFCNYGCIKVPSSECRLFALLEDSIHEVRLENYKWNFHPKLWVIQYHSINDGITKIKIIALSRNLTFDPSLDVAVEMEGVVGDSINPKNQPIADLLKFVSQFDKSERKYSQLIDNVKRVKDFDLLNCFDDYEFHPFGIYKNHKSGDITRIPHRDYCKMPQELLSNCSALFVVSPFLSDDIIGSLLDDNNPISEAGPRKRCLITRETSVNQRILDAFNTRDGDGVYVINPALSSNEASEDGNAYGNDDRDVHAKIYYTEKNKEPHKLFLGSLNASDNAFYRNVEFLLELSYKNNYTSYESFKRDFIPADDNSVNAFIRFSSVIENSEEEKENDDDFRRAEFGIKSAEVMSNKAPYTLRVNSERNFEGITICPFYQRTNIKPLTKEVIFEGLSLIDLSNMFVLTKGDETCVVRLEVINMPSEERGDAIFNKIIDEGPKLLNYILFLLEDDYIGTNYERISTRKSKGAATSESHSYEVENDLYERMLRASAEHTERFDELREVLEKIDKEKVSDRLLQLLDVFIKVTGGGKTVI